VQSQLDDVEATITKVTSIRDDTIIKFEESEKDNNELGAKLEESLQQESKQRDENAQLQQELEQLRQSNASMSTENDSKRIQLQNSLEQIAQLQQAKASLEEEVDKITKAKKKLNKEKKALAEQLQQAKDKMKVQDEMITVLNDTVKQVQGLLEDERKKVQTLTQQNTDMDDEIARLKKRIAELEAELEAAKARIKELEKQIAMHLKVMEGSKKEGFLYKLSPARKKKLQKRWFILKGVTLSYQKNGKASSKPLGSIDVTKSRVYSLTGEDSKKKSGSIYGFEITYLERGYILVAANDQERKEWVDALSTAKVHSAVVETIVATANSPPEGLDNDEDDDEEDE